ncbi:MAG: hypothetical protein ACRED9_08005 [Caulobacteraceae bacterium]
MNAAVQNKPQEPAPRRERPAPLPHALAYRIDEVQQMGGPGRTTTYRLAAEGKLVLIRVAGRTLVEGDSLRALLRQGCK